MGISGAIWSAVSYFKSAKCCFFPEWSWKTCIYLYAALFADKDICSDDIGAALGCCAAKPGIFQQSDGTRCVVYWSEALTRKPKSIFAKPSHIMLLFFGSFLQQQWSACQCLKTLAKRWLQLPHKNPFHVFMFEMSFTATRNDLCD